MAFPETILPIKVEIAPEGTWINITDYVYLEDIQITRGSADESDHSQPSRCTMRINNQDGRFSPRNPMGPYYGSLGRNTPIMVSVEDGDRYLDVPGVGAASVSDTAQIDITGDIDIRVDATLKDWAAERATNGSMELIGKCTIAGNQTSWIVLISEGIPYLRWSTDGSSSTTVGATEPLCPDAGSRLALRITLDVNNGASGHTLKFYTAPTIDGPWEQLGDDVVVAGTTSIFNSTAPLRVGNASSDLAFGTPYGKIWAAKVFNGINGTVAADIDFRIQDDGDTSFTGADGLTWTTTGGGSINNQYNRFRGEVVAWPARWTTGAFDVWVPLEAQSIKRRLNQSTEPLQSALRRRIPTDADILAYWPLEDGEDATQFGPGIPNVRYMSFTGDVTPAAHEGPHGSDSLPEFSAGSSWFAPVPGPASAAGEYQVEWVVNLRQLTTTLRTIQQVQTTGGVLLWKFQVRNDRVGIRGYMRDGTLLVNDDVLFDLSGEHLNIWSRWQFTVRPDGGGAEYTIRLIPIGGSSQSFTNTFAAGVGRVTAISGVEGLSADIEGLSWGHLAVFNVDGSSIFNNADHGFTGELAWNRVDRLTTEEGTPVVLVGAEDLTERMGAQRPDKLIDLLEESADAEHGILGDTRDWADATAFKFITRNALYNQAPRLTLGYEDDGEVHAPLDPTDDDEFTANKVTATRERGSSEIVEVTDGPLGSDAIGEYPKGVEVNVEKDTQLPHHAGWVAHLGTWDEERYPTVTVKVQAAPHLMNEVMEVDQGSRIRIVDARDETDRTFIAPGTIDLQVRGYTETLSQYKWEVTYQCVPARPYDVLSLDSLSSPVKWIDTDGTELAEDLDTTETGMTVYTTEGPTWTDEAENYPFEVMVGGEMIRVVGPGAVTPNPHFYTDLTGWSAQNSTLTRVTDFLHPDPQAVASMLITPDGVSATGGARMTAGMNTQEGAVIPSSFWVYAPNGLSDLRPVVEWYTSGGSLISQPTGSAFTIPAGEWTYCEQEFTAPATTGFVTMRVRHGNTPAAADAYYIWRAQANRRYASWAYDEFGRTLTDSWGTTDAGDTWTNAGGTVGGDYDVGSGYGSHTLSTTNVSRRSTFAAPADPDDFDIICDIACSAVATGATIFGGIIARVVDANNLYYLRVNFLTTGVIQLELRERAGGVEATLGTLFDLRRSYSAGQFFRVRFQGIGSTLRGKMWLASGGSEPEWQVSATDSTTTAGDMGVRSISSSGTTNVNPQVRYTNFQLLNPQALVVQRSINGVVKTHSLGGEVEVAFPMILAL